jgi:hypothetical protein
LISFIPIFIILIVEVIKHIVNLFKIKKYLREP